MANGALSRRVANGSLSRRVANGSLSRRVAVPNALPARGEYILSVGRLGVGSSSALARADGRVGVALVARFRSVCRGPPKSFWPRLSSRSRSVGGSLGGSEDDWANAAPRHQRIAEASTTHATSLHRMTMSYRKMKSRTRTHLAVSVETILRV
jgi:hypothetical protein